MGIVKIYFLKDFSCVLPNGTFFTFKKGKGYKMTSSYADIFIKWGYAFEYDYLSALQLDGGRE